MRPNPTKTSDSVVRVRNDGDVLLPNTNNSGPTGGPVNTRFHNLGSLGQYGLSYRPGSALDLVVDQKDSSGHREDTNHHDDEDEDDEDDHPGTPMPPLDTELFAIQQRLNTTLDELTASRTALVTLDTEQKGTQAQLERVQRELEVAKRNEDDNATLRAQAATAQAQALNKTLTAIQNEQDQHRADMTRWQREWGDRYQEMQRNLDRLTRQAQRDRFNPGTREPTPGSSADTARRYAQQLRGSRQRYDDWVASQTHGQSALPRPLGATRDIGVSDTGLPGGIGGGTGHIGATNVKGEQKYPPTDKGLQPRPLGTTGRTRKPSASLNSDSGPPDLVPLDIVPLDANFRTPGAPVTKKPGVPQDTVRVKVPRRRSSRTPAPADPNAMGAGDPNTSVTEDPDTKVFARRKSRTPRGWYDRLPAAHTEALREHSPRLNPLFRSLYQFAQKAARVGSELIPSWRTDPSDPIFRPEVHIFPETFDSDAQVYLSDRVYTAMDEVLAELRVKSGQSILTLYDMVCSNTMSPLFLALVQRKLRGSAGRTRMEVNQDIINSLTWTSPFRSERTTYVVPVDGGPIEFGSV